MSPKPGKQNGPAKIDPLEYLLNSGWKQGEGLRPGSLKKPILVKHRRDNKGLGTSSHHADNWWEKVFDSQLQTLKSKSENGSVSFEQDQEQLRMKTSKLYSQFKLGYVMNGTMEPKDGKDAVKPKDKASKEEKKKSAETKKSKKRKIEDDSGAKSKEKSDKSRREKKARKEKKSSKDRAEKKSRRK